MTMTGEEIYQNFRSGQAHTLRSAARDVAELAGVYREIAQKFVAVQDRMMESWTGGASLAAAEGAGPLPPAMELSAERLDSYAKAHSQQAQAFQTAHDTVREVPPRPEMPNPLELLKKTITHGPVETVRSYQAAVAEYNAANAHNVRVMGGYTGASIANQDIPTDYPRPKDNGGTVSAEGGGDTMTATPLVKPGPGDPGGSVPPGAGVPPGSGAPAGGGLPDGAVVPSSAGVSPVAPVADPDRTWPSKAGDPPTTTQLPPPPGGNGGPGASTDRVGRVRRTESPDEPVRCDWDYQLPGDADPDDTQQPDFTQNPGGTHTSGVTGDTALPRDGGLGAGAVPGSWGVGDRAVSDTARPGATGVGAGNPGTAFGAGRIGGAGGPGAAFGAGASGRGGPGGVGGAVPPRGHQDEDKEHTRPEYLIEPDPNALFGTDESASSPVIGEAWKPS